MTVVINQSVLPFFIIVANLTLGFWLLTLVVFVNPVIGLVVGFVIAVSYFVAYVGVRGYLKNLGKADLHQITFASKH